MKTTTKTAQIATTIADTIVWLSQCPLSRADGFYETAAWPLEQLEIDALDACVEEGLDPAIEDTIRAAVEEGELGDHEDDEAAFWRHVAAIATKN